jgi:pimeloyl-ACP methyl ester carboxylesterase
VIAAGCSTAASVSPGSGGGTSISTARGRLFVDDGGTAGLPVLFVHGNSGNSTQWAAQLAHLRATHRAAAFDLRGMGRSAPAAGGDYSVEAFAQDVSAVADALGFRHFVLVGHSFGGAVVAAYAGKHPDRLAGLVFADSAGDLRATASGEIEKLREGLAAETFETFTEAWFSATLARATDRTRADVMRSLRATPREVFVGATMGLYDFPFTDALARYSGPRLSIASYLSGNPLAVHRSIPGIPVQEIPEASHWLMMDRPEEFNRILDAFLEGLR